MSEPYELPALAADALLPRLIQSEYPERGHMMVVSDDWQAVYWLPRRQACLMNPLEDAVIKLVGETDTIMETEVNPDNGLIDFRWCYGWNAPTLDGHPRALHAHRTLTDPAAIERTLVANTTLYGGHWSELEALQPLCALRWNQAMALDESTRVVCFLNFQNLNIDAADAVLATAPVLDSGAVDWAATTLPSSPAAAESDALRDIKASLLAHLRPDRFPPVTKATE